TAKKTANKTTGKKSAVGLKTLAFDIGGTGLKASLLGERGEMRTERARVDTPKPCPPALRPEKLKEGKTQLPPVHRGAGGVPGPGAQRQNAVEREPRSGRMERLRSAAGDSETDRQTRRRHQRRRHAGPRRDQRQRCRDGDHARHGARVVAL